MAVGQNENQATEIAIFGRMIRADKGDLSKKLARFVLTVGFDQIDQLRMQDLAERNQSDQLSEREKGELFSYVKAAHLLAVLHSKARKSLRRKVS